MEKSQGSQHGGRLPRRGDPPSRDSLEGHLRAEAGVAEISALSAIGTEGRGGSPGPNGHGRAATRPRIEELCDAQMERLNRLGRRDEKHLFRIARCL